MVIKKKNHLGLEVALGTTALATAAATYYFFGKDGAKHRNKATTWAHKAKKDVVQELQKLKNVSEQNYKTTVKKVITKYKKFEKENPKEFAMISTQLQSQWKNIQKHLPKSVKAGLKKKARS